MNHLLGFAFVLVASMPISALAVDIDQVIWGFDDKVGVQQFNVVSLLVSNPTPDAADIRLRLNKVYGVGRVGAHLDEQVFLAPFSSRWVQFYPYVSTASDEWVVSWGRRASERFELPQPNSGSPARVFLRDPNQLTSRIPIKSFPDDLFPPMESATDHLEAVVMAHAPRWEEPRRQAFLDWIRRGGKLFLLQESPGVYPEFIGNLTILNAPLDSQRLGSGSVQRVEKVRAQLDREYLDQLLGEPPEDEREPTTETDSHILRQLRAMAIPKHNWPIIHLSSVIYLLLIFPGWYLLSRRRTSYGITYLGFIGVVVLFSSILHQVGKRGYGESTMVNSVAVAKQLEPGSYAVWQWSDVFVTRSETFTLTHNGSGQLYSTCQFGEPVDGWIDNGLQGSFVVDLPLFSSQSFFHRSRLTTRPFEVVVEEFEADQQELKSLTLRLGASVPQWHGVLAADVAAVVFGDKSYTMSQNGVNLKMTGPPQFLDDQLDPEQFSWQHYGYYYSTPIERATLMSHLFHPLMARSLNLQTTRDANEAFLPTDRARLFYFTPMNSDFAIRDSDLGEHGGYVLYVIDLFPHHTDPGTD